MKSSGRRFGNPNRFRADAKEFVLAAIQKLNSVIKNASIMNQPKQKISGVFQYFYHCKEEILPIRDICNTQDHGEKTEPHYENLTENWCSKCMNGRIKSANRRNVADEEATQHITSHLIKSKNILNELRKRTHELTLQTSRKNSEKRYCKTCK
jgi:hypothetical protein